MFGSFESAAVAPAVLDKLVVVSESEAVKFAHATYTMTEKGKKPETFNNPFAELWVKGPDGAWRIAYEVNGWGPVAPTAQPGH